MIYDVVCGNCGSHDFKYIDGEYRCQGCGHVLTDEEIQSLLTQAHNDFTETETEEVSFTVTFANREEATKWFKDFIDK